MSRRQCLVSISRRYEPVFVGLLQNVSVVAREEVINAPIVILRLEGPGLPDWCAEPPYGQCYPWASTLVVNDGVVRFIRQVPPETQPAPKQSPPPIDDGPRPGNMIEWLERQAKHRN
jgi:hypothetical protein